MARANDVSMAGEGRRAGFWARLPTGPKMLVILTLGLLPLGIIAILTSIHSARENSAERAAQTLARLDEKAERLNELLTQAAGTMRAANATLAAALAGVKPAVAQRIGPSGR